MFDFLLHSQPPKIMIEKYLGLVLPFTSPGEDFDCIIMSTESHACVILHAKCLCNTSLACTVRLDVDACVCVRRWVRSTRWKHIVWVCKLSIFHGRNALTQSANESSLIAWAIEERMSDKICGAATSMHSCMANCSTYHALWWSDIQTHRACKLPLVHVNEGRVLPWRDMKRHRNTAYGFGRKSPWHCDCNVDAVTTCQAYAARRLQARRNQSTTFWPLSELATYSV